VIEPGDEQAIFNGIKALGTLRMTLSHFVQATIRVCEIASSAHGYFKKRGTKCEALSLSRHLHAFQRLNSRHANFVFDLDQFGAEYFSGRTTRRKCQKIKVKK
jgi:hypothetical protein